MYARRDCRGSSALGMTKDSSRRRFAPRDGRNGSRRVRPFFRRRSLGDGRSLDPFRQRIPQRHMDASLPPPPRDRGPTYRVAQESARIIRKSPVPDRPACPYERGSAESCLFGDVLSTFRCSQFSEKSRRELPQRRTPRKMHLPFSISLSYKGNTISAAGEDIDASRFRRGGTKRRRPAGDGVSEKVEEV